MDKINQLKHDINEIEDEAGQLDPKDYETLYKLLATAYFKAKDIIELHDEMNPIATEPVDDSALVEANVQIIELTAYKEEAAQVIIDLQSKITQVLKIVS